MSHLLEIRLFLGTKNYEERNVCPTKLIPMKEKMGKIGARKGGIEGDSKLFGWGTKWIWIEMRVTADRN